jgi:pilus assembly protein CpaE
MATALIRIEAMMGRQEYPFELGKDNELRLPPQLLIAASESYVDELTAAITPAERMTISCLAVPPAAGIAEEILARASCIVIEVDPTVPESLERLATIRRKAPSLPQVVALARANVALVRSLVKQGVADVVSLPFEMEELLQASVAAVEASIAATPKTTRLAPVVAVVKSIGGCGATTLAAHLADELGRHSPGGRGACLVDLDVQQGSAAPMLGIAPRRGLNELLGAGERLDREFLRSVSAAHSDHLHLIAAPEDIMPLESIETDRLLAVLDIARGEFDRVVLDLPANWTSWNLSAVVAADLVLIVVSLDIASLRQAKRQIELFRSAGIDPRKLAVAVNRVEKRLFRLISLDDVAKTLKLPILGSVHLDGQLLAAAHDQGLLARQVQKKSQFMNAIAALAESIDDELAPNGAR